MKPDIETIVIRSLFHRLRSEAECFCNAWKELGGNDRWSEHVGDTSLPDLISAIRDIEDFLP